ncbi:MAG TPA: hypothetical protein VMF90_24800 [Rhizobiaceae bacterium]|nr:hypothetical protein [Rhizobiaceae bacterium]
MLKTSLFRPLVAALSAGAIALSAVTSVEAAAYVVAGAEEAPLLGEIMPTEEGTQVAAADCYAIGQQVAAENGGELAKAQASNQGGQEVCVIVVLVPGKAGQRPRRVQVVVPAG